MERKKSKGHICFSGIWEFIEVTSGDLFRAPVYEPVQANGWRVAAFETTKASKGEDNWQTYLRNEGFDL